MIRVNLLGEKTDNSHGHALQIAGFVVSVVALVLVCAMVQMNATQQIDLMTADKAALDMELADLKMITKGVGDLEHR